jgi:hypothetical protein
MDMTRSRLNRLSLALPLLFSALAFALVIANIIAGTPPHADENTSAHTWQLLMAAQLPLVILFIATADWRTRMPALFVAVQLAAIALTCLPVWLAGY